MAKRPDETRHRERLVGVANALAVREALLRATARQAGTRHGDVRAIARFRFDASHDKASRVTRPGRASRRRRIRCLCPRDSWLLLFAQGTASDGKAATAYRSWVE